MEIIDKRFLDASGDRIAQDEPKIITAEQLRSAIADVPRVYAPPLPVLDRILVLRSKADVTFEGTNLIVPDIAKKDPNKGVVAAVSPVLIEHGVPLGGLWVPCQIKVGDVVTFTQFTEEQFKVGDSVFVLIRVHDVKFVESVSFAVATGFSSEKIQPRMVYGN